ncbi:flavodoxin family protein [Jannaschia ovalis]|uniref:NAD(P)H-dependent oxidoreductase n=1 Tax=Jannaschia ovalis TaxID=3038773 RepID=A0ABY8LC56_9RHOB|nr:NAD(P)H-dependent oxidoreductase [Jannaschia sp. GRR-S6-38]WGH77630.1 NAD(P)H-dependent oxidoreductase [Jannaschia sp. GRR-S6-38]
MDLHPKAAATCGGDAPDYTGLTALLVNTSLKRRSADSHTDILLGQVGTLMARAGVSVDRLHMLDHQVAFGVQPDMTAHGWERDDWPALWDRVRAADILIVGTPLWLGEESSVCRVLIERLYGMSGQLNDRGQSVYYGRVGGCVVTGNEDGVKHAAMTLCYALSHLGYTIPPQADCGWIGEAGPGPSYGDTVDGKRVGFDNDFTARNATIMAWNCMHLAKMLKGGIPNHGNDRRVWQAEGCDPSLPNPEHRV